MEPIFLRSNPGLNSEFSFSKACCVFNAKEIRLPYYLPIPGGEPMDLRLSQKL